MGERQTMADRSVATTDTLETFRSTYNSTATDVGDIGDFGTYGPKLSDLWTKVSDQMQ